MKKFLKWSGIVVGSLLVILVIGVIALPFILPLEKIKDLAAAKISETINREVKVEKVSFNLFEGIKLNKLTISNRPGYAKTPFVSADAIVLRYAFWPIFKRQIIIKEISLVKPEVLIEKASNSQFNFSDMGERRNERETEGKEGRKRGKKEEKGKQDFSLIVDSFSIKNGRITYVDHGARSQSEIKNAKLSVAGLTLSFIRPIDLKFAATATYQGKDIPVSLNGKIKVDLAKELVNVPSLVLNLAGEQAALSATIANWKNGPFIDFSISSKKLSLDPLLAIFAAGGPAKEQKKTRPGELTSTINQAAKAIPARLKIKGVLDIEKLTVLNFRVDKINAGFSLVDKNLFAELKEVKLYGGTLTGLGQVNLASPGLSYNVKNLKLAGFNASAFSNDLVRAFLTKLDNYQDLVNKVYGQLDVSLSLAGKGVEVPAIMANLQARGSLSLKNGELKRLKTIDAIADKLKTPALKQDLKISLLATEFLFSNQVLTIKNLDLKDSDLQVKFDGGLDLNNLKYVAGNRLRLRASPSATKGLSQEYNLLRDKDGWLEITVELTGSLKLPIPRPILDKPIEKVIGKIKATIDVKKIEIEQQVSQEVEAKKEAVKEQVKEEAKKQLKNLIKF